MTKKKKRMKKKNDYYSQMLIHASKAHKHKMLSRSTDSLIIVTVSLQILLESVERHEQPWMLQPKTIFLSISWHAAIP